MFLNKLKVGAVVLLASCTMASMSILATERAQVDRVDKGPIAAKTGGGPGSPRDPAANAAARAEKPPAAGGDGGVQSKGRLFTPDGKLVYVNLSSTAEGVDQNFVHNFVNVNIVPEVKRVRGVGTATILGNRGHEMRIRLNPDRMRAYKLSSEDIIRALTPSTMNVNSQLYRATKTRQSKENELIHASRRYNKPQQYENIILKANPDGEILRLKDVGQVDLGASISDISLEIDGHPAAAIVFKQAPGSNAAEVIEAVKEKLKHIKEELFPPGMEFQVIPLDSRDMVCAVIETPRGSTLEYTSAKCLQLGAMARDLEGITSVFSLAGYQIRTEGRDSNVATCLIRLKDRSDRKLTSRQIIEKLDEKGHTISNVILESFEPPAVSVFVAAGGFSVRVLDRTNVSNDEQPGRVPETFMDDLLKRKNLETLFQFFAGNYPQSELVINNDVAMRKGVSIADAIESRFKVVGSDVQAEPKSQRLVEDFSQLSFKNDRGEMVPYSSFMQLRMKPGLNESDR